MATDNAHCQAAASVEAIRLGPCASACQAILWIDCIVLIVILLDRVAVVTIHHSGWGETASQFVND
jgi:hypothetical protein